MSEMVFKAAQAIVATAEYQAIDELAQDETRAEVFARAVIEALRDVENDTLAAGYSAMFEDKWNGTQAPMMGAGWEAMLDAALANRDAGLAKSE